MNFKSTRLFNQFRHLIATTAVWLCVAATTLAAPGPAGAPPQARQPGANSWVFSYMIVLVTIAISIFLICRPSRRSDQAGPAGYDSVYDKKD
jgi:hypothetical protein